MSQTYGIETTLEMNIDQAESLVRDALVAEGFGVLTEIDIAATLKAKLDVDRSPYKILGACNPTLANQALAVDENIGLLLPCNVILYETNGATTVSAVDPAAMMSIAKSDALHDVANEAKERLERAIASIG